MNKLTIRVSLRPSVLYIISEGERITFANTLDARTYAKENGYDGITIKMGLCDTWPGLKPLVDGLIGKTASK